MADHQEASVTLPSDPASVSAARTFVLSTLAEWGMPADTDDADTIRLIVSELATNAVQHTFGQSPTFTVEIELDRDETLRVGVTDSHPRFPKRLPAAVQQDNGRGMVIIRWLTAECGGRLRFRPTGEGGKTVFVELPWTGPTRPAEGRAVPGRPVSAAGQQEP
ncbi:ATP-binding protein [Streptomyces sp. YIM S03343]